MNSNQSSYKIKEVAMELDNAIEKNDIELILSYFSNDCQIELLGIKLIGKEGVKKWLKWLYENIYEIKFEPITIIVNDDTFFEEFIVNAKLHNGKEIKSKQAEVLKYENYKIKSIRLYFNPLDFVKEIVKGPIDKLIINHLMIKSLKGLI